MKSTNNDSGKSGATNKAGTTASNFYPSICQYFKMTICHIYFNQKVKIWQRTRNVRIVKIEDAKNFGIVIG